MPSIGIADKTTLDAVKIKVDANLDATVSTRATQTSADTINTNVGSNADAPSATGSVHAKLKDIKSSLTSVSGGADLTGSRPILAYRQTNDTTWTTVIDITGKGMACVMAGPNNGSCSIGVRITVDGVQLESRTLSLQSSTHAIYGKTTIGSPSWSPIGNWGRHNAISSSFSSTVSDTSPNIGFKTSFKYEVYTTNTSIPAIGVAEVVLF